MDLREAWRVSKIPYNELAYRATDLVSTPGAPDKGAQHYRSVMNGVRANKARFAIFVCLGAATPFVVFALTPTAFMLVSAVALCLVTTFAFLVLYSLQMAPSLVNADAYSLMRTFPLSEKDFSAIALLSFARNFDYLAMGSILTSVAAIAFLTRSIAASVLMLGASTVNALFAILVGLWVSRVFYRNMNRGGRSRSAQASRTIFLLTWGFAILSMGFAFSAVVELLPYLNQILSGNLSPASAGILSLLHPLAFGIVISSFVYPEVLASGGPVMGLPLLAALSIFAALAYALASPFAVMRTARMIGSMALGQATVMVREAAKEFTLKVRGPFAAYVLKDTRLGLRSPATAFVFALPLFAPLVIYTMSSDQKTWGVTDFSFSILVGSIYPLLAGYLLLYSETMGMRYTLTLPVGRSVIVGSKSLISTMTYLTVPLTLLALEYYNVGVLTAPSLMPFIEVLAISASTTALLAIMIPGYGGSTNQRVSGGGAGSARRETAAVIATASFGRTAEAYGAAFALVMAPLAVCFVTSLVYPVEAALVVMAAVGALEVGVVNAILRRRT